MRKAVTDAMEEGKVPGVVAFLSSNGRLMFHEAFGFAQIRPEPVKMRKGAIFDLASLTKPCATALALMILADDGILALRDRVARWIPWFAPGEKGGVTLLDLLTHTGGLDDRGLYDPKTPMETESAPIELLGKKALFAAPGETYLYADLNYIALGKVVEAASGERLDLFFTRRIARPLGLRTACFNPPAVLRPRIAATELAPEGMLRGKVHDPRARLMGGVAGHAGLFASAEDVWAIAEMLLGGGKFRGRRLLSEAAARVMTSVQSPPGLRPRMIGWDTDPDGYGPRGDLFPFGGFGHTGFTGTSVWADPNSRSVLVLLSNRVHPDGKGGAEALRRHAANAAAAVLGRRQETRRTGRPGSVLSGADVQEKGNWRALRGKRIGLVTNLSAVNRRGNVTLDLVARARGVKIAAIFAPEHGLAALIDEKFGGGRHAELGVPVHSLYGDNLRPAPADLAGLDALVVDLPDVGARFYTYPATLAYCLEEAAKAGLKVIVLDRPNPITGLMVEGPLLEESRFGFLGYAALPVRHGMTLGELGLFFNRERKIGADLEVIEAAGWRRSMWFDETGLPWANPSPNIRSLLQATLYPALGLLEFTNLSVGRGTDAPFERFGAPWLRGEAVARDLNGLDLPGVRFYPADFSPASGPFAGERCGGCALELEDRGAFRPVLTGASIADVLLRRYRGIFRTEKLDGMFGTGALRESLAKAVPAARIAEEWRREEEEFRKRRNRHLLY